MPASLKIRAALRQLLVSCVLLALAGAPAHAQQTTGVPGSADATTTIDGRYLPPPPQRFQGQINLNAAQSKPAWPARVVPPKSAPNILLDNGYRTSWFGKNHNTPVYQLSQAGPFDQWPTGMGFEHFYGFMGGDADQWGPGSLYRDTTHIQPFIGNPQWNLITAMADEAVHWVNELNDINPDLPFLLYYAPGGTHSPHHPTPEWIKKIGDMHLFDKGWNAVREQIFANQKRLGVIPQDA